MRLATTLWLTVALSTAILVPRSYGVDTDIDGNPYAPKPSITPFQPIKGAQGGGVLVFNDQAAFLAAAGAVTTETFEDDASSGVCDGFGLTLRSEADFLATSNVLALKLLREPCFGNHNTTPGGQKYLSADTEIGDVSADVMFIFNQPITALGLFLVDLDSALLEVTINGVSYPVPAHGDAGESYFGLVGAFPFTSATFHIAAGVDSHYSFDDVAYSLSGPVSTEPSSWGRSKEAYRD